MAENTRYLRFEMRDIFRLTNLWQFMENILHDKETGESNYMFNDTLFEQILYNKSFGIANRLQMRLIYFDLLFIHGDWLMF